MGFAPLYYMYNAENKMNTTELYRQIISYMDSGNACRLITTWSGDEGMVTDLKRELLPVKDAPNESESCHGDFADTGSFTANPVSTGSCITDSVGTGSCTADLAATNSCTANPMGTGSCTADSAVSGTCLANLAATDHCLADVCLADTGSHPVSSMNSMCETFTPPARLIIFGGGHICLPLVQFASRTGFCVTVIDDRSEFANPERFPEAEHVICKPYPKVLGELQLTPYDYVCILTRGHYSDGVCLRGIHKLSLPSLTGMIPAYIGMIGSRRRVRAQFDMLEKEGMDRSWLDSIHTPIGLAIGAVTPAEIAVSILAELIMCKRKLDAEQVSESRSDVESPVLRFLAKNKEPQAIVTIVDATGSTPRSTGAKMAVDINGRITGTVGGGYAEGLLIEEAKKIIGTGRFKVHNIDLNGDVAAADGMACGGKLKVLVEDSYTGTAF